MSALGASKAGERCKPPPTGKPENCAKNQGLDPRFLCLLHVTRAQTLVNVLNSIAGEGQGR